NLSAAGVAVKARGVPFGRVPEHVLPGLQPNRSLPVCELVTATFPLPAITTFKFCGGPVNFTLREEFRSTAKVQGEVPEHLDSEPVPDDHPSNAEPASGVATNCTAEWYGKVDMQPPSSTPSLITHVARLTPVVRFARNFPDPVPPKNSVRGMGRDF